MNPLTRWDMFIAALGAMIPVLCVFITFHIQNRSDKKKSDARLGVLLDEHPLHSHGEADEPIVEIDRPLTVRNLRYPRRSSSSR